MSDGYDEDLKRYLESAGPSRRPLDNRALMKPISTLRYPKKPLAFDPGAPPAEALKAMAAKNLGAVLVVEEGKVVGIFSERDALKKRLFEEGDGGASLRELMTPNPDCLTPDDSIAFAMNRMGVGGYRHIPLVDAERRPLGMLVMRDLVRYIVTFFPAEALNLPPHSEHAPPDRRAEGG